MVTHFVALDEDGPGFELHPLDPPALFSYLKESGGSVNPAILSAISEGRLGVGDVLQTAAYWAGSSIGGTTYRVVSSGTGVDDGGSFVTAGTLQLRALFGDTIGTAAFGMGEGRPLAVNSSAMEAALAYAQGRRVQLPAGSMQCEFAHTGPVDIDGNGATLLQSTGRCIDIRAEWADVTSVTAIDTASWTGPSGAAATVSRLTAVSVPASFTVGRTVKVASDDSFPIAFGETQNGQGAIGEHATVVAVTSTTITLDRVLRFAGNYSTNPRVAPVPEGPCEIRNLSLDTTSSVVQDLAIISGFDGAVVENVHVVKANTVAIYLAGCTRFSVTGCSMSNCADNAGNNSYGYGIALAGCSNGTVSNLQGRLVRHLTTTVVIDPVSSITDPAPSLSWYGATHDVEFSDSTCSASTGAGFDTHEGSYDCVLSNLITNGALGATGISVRGHGHTVIGCRAIGVRDGFLALALSENATTDIKFIDCVAVASRRGITTTTGNTTDDTNKIGIEVIGGSFDGGEYGAFLNNSNAVLMGGSRFVSRSTSTSHGVVGAEQSVVEIADCVVESKTTDIPKIRRLRAGASVSVRENARFVGVGTPDAMAAGVAGSIVTGPDVAPWDSTRQINPVDYGRTYRRTFGGVQLVNDFSNRAVPPGFTTRIINGVNSVMPVTFGANCVAQFSDETTTNTPFDVAVGATATFIKVSEYPTSPAVWFVLIEGP